MTAEEKQAIIEELLTSASNSLDITSLSAAESLEGISTFPAIQATTSGGTTSYALVKVPISLLTQAVQDVITNANTATSAARSAASGWAAAAVKMGSDIVVIEGDITNLQDADKSLSSLTAYAECSTAANVSAKAVTVPFFSLPTNGGCLHVKMANANTAVSGVTLNINATGAKDLFYNGSAVSATNTWEDNEVLQIYYDGTNEIYQATNAQGGGSANRISYDNSVSGLSADNVQDAIGEVKNKILPPTVIDLSLITEVTGGMANNGKWFPSTDPEFNRKGKYVPVKAGSSYTLLCDDNANYAFMTTNSTPVANGNMPLANGCVRESIAANTAVNVVAPSGANYIYIQTEYPTQQITVTWSISLVPQSLGDMTDDIPSENSNQPFSSNGAYVLEQGIKALRDSIFSEVTVDSSEMTTYSGFYLPAKSNSTKWTSHSERAVTFIPLSEGYDYSLLASENTNYGYLTNNSEPKTTDTVPYVSGEDRHNYSVTDGTITLEIPNGAKYLCVISTIGGNALTLTIKKTPKELSAIILQAIQDIEGVNSKVGPIDLSQYPETSAAMSNGTTWADITDRKSKFIPITSGCHYKITAQSYSTNYAFMKDDSYAIGATQNFASGESRHSLLANESVTVQAPSDAKFLYILTYIPNDYRTPVVECVASSDSDKKNYLSAQGMSAMKNGVVVSEEQYNYAFAPFTFYQGNHIKMVFVGNTLLDGDSTINTNDVVLATYSPMTREWTNAVMPSIEQIVDSDGNSISGITRAYNNCVYVPFENDIGMFGAMGNGSSAGFSWGYKTTWAGTTYTRCHLVYGNTEVEFSSSNYRQMLVDKGWMNSKVNANGAAVDCTAIFMVGSIYYVVMCTYLIKAEKVELPLVLLSSTDLATWTVEKRLGSNVHPASEISFAINDGKVYVIYRALHTTNNTDASNGYGIGMYNLSDGSAIYETEIKSYVMSLPICFAVNGNAWCGFNERASILGTPNSFEYLGDRQQMAFYKFTDTGIDYQFSIENPAGINYPTSVTIPKKNSQGNVVNNLDRIYMAWSEDRRGMYYRQIANVTIADMTDVFK